MFGTVIIYKGQAFVFWGMTTLDATQEFITEWRPGANGFSVHSIRGSTRETT